MKLHTKLLSVFACTAAVVGLAGCGGGKAADTAKTKAPAEKKTVTLTVW